AGDRRLRVANDGRRVTGMTTDDLIAPPGSIASTWPPLVPRLRPAFAYTAPSADAARCTVSEPWSSTSVARVPGAVWSWRAVDRHPPCSHDRGLPSVAGRCGTPAVPRPGMACPMGRWRADRPVGGHALDADRGGVAASTVQRRKRPDSASRSRRAP